MTNPLRQNDLSPWGSSPSMIRYVSCKAWSTEPIQARTMLTQSIWLLRKSQPPTPIAQLMATDAPVVNLHVTLLDKSQSKAVAGTASLDTCVWKLGEQSGMLLGAVQHPLVALALGFCMGFPSRFEQLSAGLGNGFLCRPMPRLSLTTSPQSNFGYVFRSGAGVWRSNQHPRLTLADAGVTKTGRGGGPLMQGVPQETMADPVHHFICQIPKWFDFWKSSPQPSPAKPSPPKPSPQTPSTTAIVGIIR